MARRHIHEEMFDVEAERLFDLLITPSAIRQWWSAARAIVIAEAGGLWAAAWGDDEDAPDYVTVAKIREFESGSRMLLTDYRYLAKSGPLPFDADFSTEFVVASQTHGASLKVTQDGFPDDSSADEYYAACERGWKDTFAGIRRYLNPELPGAIESPAS